MTKVIQHHPTDAVDFPRLIIPGIQPADVAFEDFTIELKDSKELGLGKVEIIHQTSGLKIALQVVHAKNLTEFDRLLGNGISMHLNLQYIAGDYSFLVILSGMSGEFAEEDSDFHVRLHRLYDAQCAGAGWYHRYIAQRSRTHSV